MSNETLYREKMEQGRVCLGVGNLDMASVAYNNAAGYAPDNISQAKARQMRGIVLRMAEDFTNAHRDFEKARRLAGEDTSLVARILRDQGMCYLAQVDYADDGRKTLETAKECIETSMKNLQALGDKVEAAASRTFLGRVYLKDGDRKWAETLFRQAHRDLRGRHPVYEMNNLPWLGRVSLLQRWLNAPRALYLGLRYYPDNGAKLKEYAALLVGGEQLRDTLHARRR